jgi:hypothetical protein
VIGWEFGIAHLVASTEWLEPKGLGSIIVTSVPYCRVGFESWFHWYKYGMTGAK